MVENTQNGTVIDLGYKGENAARKVKICVKEISGNTADGGTWGIIHKKQSATAAYSVDASQISFANGYLYWAVATADVATVGEGEAQITYTVGDTVAKTEIFKTLVHNSLTV